MLAAENGGLPGGKVGGMGDVLRDLPRALVRAGYRVTVLSPSYGFLARLPGAALRGSVPVAFGGQIESCRQLSVPSERENLEYWLLDHDRFAPRGEERIYHDDGPGEPFATDASKFAFFSAAAAALLAGLPVKPDVLHLHDWHTGLFFLLRAFDPKYRALKSVRAVFTIHNLALQGLRPLEGAGSSLEQWLPDLKAPADVLADARYPDCVNPMAIAIRLADAVNTVSPTYAREILQSADVAGGRHGGEGLESLLAARDRDGALSGILNGCEYAAGAQPRAGWKRLVALMQAELDAWIAAGEFVDTAAWLAAKRVAALPRQKPAVLATSIGRVTEQKLGLCRLTLAPDETALDQVLGVLDRGLLIVLGSGDGDYERFLQQRMTRHQNLIFLKGYSERLAQMLYATGDLFLMPSVFEPCGISQMLAMRGGQPCVVHAVGGLRDTVSRSTGFPFGGETPEQQARNFVREVAGAVRLKLDDRGKWEALVAAAKRARFSWDAAARQYAAKVYAFDADDAR